MKIQYVLRNDPFEYLELRSIHQNLLCINMIKHISLIFFYNAAVSKSVSNKDKQPIIQISVDAYTLESIKLGSVNLLMRKNDILKLNL